MVFRNPDCPVKNNLKLLKKDKVLKVENLNDTTKCKYKYRTHDIICEEIQLLANRQYL